MGAFLFMTSTSIRSRRRRPPSKPEKQATPQQATAGDSAAGLATPTPRPPARSPERSPSCTQSKRTCTRLCFSNHGAVVRSWELKQYRDGARKPLQLVNTVGASKTHYPFAFLFENQAPSADLNQSLYVGKPTPDGLGIDFEFSNGRSTSRKSFRFLKNSYLSAGHLRSDGERDRVPASSLLERRIRRHHHHRSSRAQRRCTSTRPITNW